MLIGSYVLEELSAFVQGSPSIVVSLSNWLLENTAYLTLRIDLKYTVCLVTSPIEGILIVVKNV